MDTPIRVIDTLTRVSDTLQLVLGTPARALKVVPASDAILDWLKCAHFARKAARPRATFTVKPQTLNPQSLTPNPQPLTPNV